MARGVVEHFIPLKVSVEEAKMLWILVFFLLGVFLGGFAAAFFDFGVKIQFVTGKSALPEWKESENTTTGIG